MNSLVPAHRTMEIAEAQDQLPSVLKRVSRDQRRVVVEERGVSVAAIVSTADLERLERLDREREIDFEVIDEVRAAFSGVPEAEVERETDRILGINRDEGVAGS